MWSDIVFKSITNNIKYGPFRSNRPEVFCEKGVLRTTLLKKETLAQVFSGEFSEISKNTFSYRTSPVAASALYSETSIII